MNTFETLCTGNAYIYSQPKFKEYRKYIETLNYFEPLKAVDPTRTKEVADVLSLFYRQILLQPYWYIEALELYPHDTVKQRQYLYDNIELAKDRFDYYGRGIFRIKKQFRELSKNDRPAAQRLFEEILFFTDELLHEDIGVISFEILHFNLKESPLFIVFMEFIHDIKQRAGNPYYTKIDKYLNDIENYKAKFQKVGQNTETPAPPPPAETTADKIEKALEELKKELKGAFFETGHIDKIIEALAEYAKGKTPDCVENGINDCKHSKFLSKKFFEPFKGLNKTIGLTNKQIAEVLRCFIYPFTGSKKQLEVDSIITSLKGRKSY